MSDLRAPNPFGKTHIPPFSSNENTASYTIPRELLSEIIPSIVAYYTFPGLEDYVNMPSAIRSVKEESYLPTDTESNLDNAAAQPLHEG